VCDREFADEGQARAQGAASKGGKLSAQLQAQKKQTMNETLKEASETERRRRDQDATAEAIAHN
jgi:3-keto-L-gulonate-6-phosphate decarboxylase